MLCIGLTEMPCYVTSSASLARGVQLWTVLVGGTGQSVSLGFGLLTGRTDLPTKHNTLDMLEESTLEH